MISSSEMSQSLKAIDSTPKAKISRVAFPILGILLALLPILRLVLFLRSAGENNISTDSFLFLGFIDKILQGQSSWKDFFLYPMINGHLSTVPLLTLIADAKWFSLDIYPLLALGIFLAALEVAMLFDALFRHFEGSLKWLLLPVLSALVFAPTQVSTFEYEITSLQFHWNQFGFILGVWGLSRFSGRWLGLVCACLGGMIATYSQGLGPLVWPVYFLGLWFFGYRKLSQYVFIILAGFIACLPYINVFLFPENFSRLPEFQKMLASNLFQSIGVSFVPGQRSPVVSLLNISLLLQFLGWSLSPEIGSSFSLYLRAGTLLLGFSIGIIVLIRSLDLRLRHSLAVAALVFLYGILSAYLITVFRRTYLPWYATAFMPAYLAWAGLALATLLAWRILPGSSRVWALTSAFAIGYFFAASNQSFIKNSLYLQFRSPVSNACLQEFEVSPTYCESALFWTKGHYEALLGYFEKLREGKLSVFSSHRRRTLQGDWILGRVTLNQREKIPRVFWTADLGSKEVSFQDPRHLNLFLHAPNSVEWNLSLPSSSKEAVFRSAVAVSRSAPIALHSDGVRFEVSISVEEGPYQRVFSKTLAPENREWHPFQISLVQYAGKRLRIKLSSEGLSNLDNDWGLFRYPHIDLSLDPASLGSRSSSRPYRPLNTELGEAPPRASVEDYVFNLSNSQEWEWSGVSRIEGIQEISKSWRLEGKPKWNYLGPLDIPASRYSFLYFRLRLPYEVFPLIPTITLTLRGNPDYQKTIKIPPLSDGAMHEYHFDLRLLELDPEARIVGLKFEFLRDPPAQNEISFSDLRLIPASSP